MTSWKPESIVVPVFPYFWCSFVVDKQVLFSLSRERNINPTLSPPFLWEHPAGQLSCLFTAHQCQIKNTLHSSKRVFMVYQVIFDLYHCGHTPAQTNYFHLPTPPSIFSHRAQHFKHLTSKFDSICTAHCYHPGGSLPFLALFLPLV